jgi:ATP-dependent Lhr-like helicase
MHRIEQWFEANGWTPFEFQRKTWAAQLAGRSGLVHAPTGTGKTQAVWLGPVAEYLNEQERGSDAATEGVEAERARAAVCAVDHAVAGAGQ